MFGGLFGPRGQSILAHGYNGAWHRWVREETATAAGSDIAVNQRAATKNGDSHSDNNRDDKSVTDEVQSSDQGEHASREQTDGPHAAISVSVAASVAVAERWRPALVVSGHFAPVEDVAWHAQGAYVLNINFLSLYICFIIIYFVSD